ncbi:MAG: hypothetical protein N3G21_09005, partial [Candidatus Hydrogenedentes bacterium]|nr:hypothetical protein [Candidatus Hydrogenedentota bacterium]
MEREYEKLSREELIEELKRLIGEAERHSKAKDGEVGVAERYYDEFTLKPLFDAMDAIDTAVYVADMDTYEILACNEYLKKFWGENIVGEKCYLVLQQGEVEPCPYCTNDRLLNEEGKPNPPYVWAFKNTKTGSYYQCIDFAI